jgi:ferredoxin
MSTLATQLVRLTFEKFPENEPGRYAVNQECIDCDLCRQIAPKNFTRQMTKGHSYVYQQPETQQQEAQCQDAVATCPVAAIEANNA